MAELCRISFVKFATLGGTQIPNSDTFSNSVDKALGCKLRGMSLRYNNNTRKKYNISHANDGGP